MANAGQDKALTISPNPAPGQRAGLEGVVDAARAAAGQVRGLPPVHLWNPPFCGDIDMRIAADGTWFYLGTPIGRPALVRLFSTVLKREGTSYFLVTPVEKCGITVDDVPFLAVEMTVTPADTGPCLAFRTNVDDGVTCDADHPLRFERRADGGVVPYLHVRSDLWARLTRPLYYDLIALGFEKEIDGALMFGVESCGVYFPICPANEMKEDA